MKKIITTTLLCFIAFNVFSQVTYYWAGGVTASWTAASNWNTALNGSGTSRVTPDVTDILIFDGTNIGGSTPTTGIVNVSNVIYQTIGSLVFRNAANVRFSGSPATAGVGSTAAGALVGSTGYFSGQTVAGTSTSFSSFFLVGDFISYATTNTGTGGTNSIGQITAIASNTSLTQSNGNLAMLATNGTSTFYVRDVVVRIANSFSVDATSFVEMGSSAPLIFRLNAGATGVVNGTVAITTNFQKLVMDPASSTSIVFNSGSKFQFTGTQSTAPFDGVATATNNNIIFRSGASYENNGTTAATTNACGSVFGGIIPFSVVDFQKGSTYVQNSITFSSLLGSSYRSYPNVLLNGATSGMQSTSPVDTLTVSANTTWTNASGSFFPIKGDFIINGTYAGVATTPVFVFCGNVVQNLTVTGSIASGGLYRIIVAPNSSLKLGSNITQSTNTTTASQARIYGTINFGTYSLNAASTTSNSLIGYNVANSVPGSQTGGVVAAATPNLITFPTSISGLTQGTQITGAGVPDNTIIVNTSGLTIFTSNPIATNSNLTVTANVNANGATFITANTAGLGGSYPNTPATFTLPGSTGINFQFDAATTTPFPASLTSVNTNNLALNAAVASNLVTLNVGGTIALNNGIFTVPTGDTVRLTSGTAVAGTPFDATKHIALGANTSTGDRGFLRVSNISTATLLPIGSNGNYLPLTITPAAAGEDYSVNAFNGITSNSTPNGTAFTAAQKANVVDAVWTINNNFTPTGNATLQVGWPASLEGSNFTNYGNNIGLAPYNSSWGTPIGNGNNTTNIATTSVNAFGSFAVGSLGSVLPVKFISIIANLVNTTQAKISWQVSTEIDVNEYQIEVSSDGIFFNKSGTILASGKSAYTFVDALLFKSGNYYRVKAVYKSGASIYSSIVVIPASNITSTTVVNVYPNPIVNRTLNVYINNHVNQVYQLQLIDNSGKIITTKTINYNVGFAVYNVELNTISPGVYHLKITGKNEALSKDVIIR